MEARRDFLICRARFEFQQNVKRAEEMKAPRLAKLEK